MTREMSLLSELRSRYPRAEVVPQEDGRESVEVYFPHWNRSVMVIVDEAGDRYSASYPEWVRDGRGGWKVEPGFLSEMKMAGALWILRQVDRHGKVKPAAGD